MPSSRDAFNSGLTSADSPVRSARRGGAAGDDGKKARQGPLAVDGHCHALVTQRDKGG
jgi:hypothetical protein